MFEPYDFGRDYRQAHLAQIEQDADVTEKILDWTLNPRNILYFCGNVGTGKTYFCAAFYNSLKEQGKQVRVYSEQHLFNELKLCMNMPGEDANLRLSTICETEYFILDDMGSSMMTDWQKEMLFSFVDTRFKNSMPTVITSNLSYADIKETFHLRFASRLYAAKNTVIEFNGPDRRKNS